MRFRIGAYFKSTADGEEDEVEDRRGDPEGLQSLVDSASAGGSRQQVRGGDGGDEAADGDEDGVLEGDGMQGLWDCSGGVGVGACLV